MSEEALASGQVYEHYKGGIYVVWAIAKVEATLEEVVVYMGQDGQFWTRPVANFQEYVALGDTEVPRFKRITE